VIGLGAIGGVAAGCLIATGRYDVVACVRAPLDRLTLDAPDGTIEATFVDRPTLDAVSGNPAVAIYQRTAAGGYTLTAEGGSRIADDMSAFFTGVRETRFTFVSVEGLHSAA